MKASLFWRLLATVVSTLLLYVAMNLYSSAMSGIDAAIAVNQVKESIIDNALSKTFMQSHLGTYLIPGVYLLVLIAIWRGALKKGASLKNDQQVR